MAHETKEPVTISPLAGKPAPTAMLVDVAQLEQAGLKDVSYLRLGKVDHCPHSLIRVPWLQPAVNEFFLRTLAAH